MLIEKVVRAGYRVANRFPGLVRNAKFVLPRSIEARITDTVLQGRSVPGDRKLVFRDGRYENRVAHNGLKAGCNLVGFVFGEFGIGEHLRYTARSLLAEGIPFSLYNYDRTLHPQADFSLEAFVGTDTPYNTNIFCMNNEGIMNLHASNPELFKDRYNIGYGFWELSDYPDEWLYPMNYLDEIWAPSRYIQGVISRKASVPMVHMPMAVDFQLPGGLGRKAYGISEDAFVLLYSLDFSSRIHRKNPEGVIRAFREAFPAGRKDVVLVIKTKIVESVQQQVTDYNLLKDWVQDDSRVLLINKTFTKEQMLDLIGCCDVYVSLHRAEGFGLGMAEAMKMGKAVIATGYSGNMDFTGQNNTCLVDYALTNVPQGSYYMQGESVWAEPDVEQAAGYMRRLFEDEEFRREIGARAKAFIGEHHSFKRTGERYRRRLKFIGLM
ncbi:glycosyltransferase, group 1 family protein [delta proteobacterium NaphS2]|nr:glycosyltransferase, group 1 family protein [delta proteobacterium NaphS2]